MRIDVYPQNYKQTILNNKDTLIAKAKSYWLYNLPDGSEDFSFSLLADSVSEYVLGLNLNIKDIDFTHLIQVSFKPGVTDNSARSTQYILQKKFNNTQIEVATGELYFIKTKSDLNELKDLFGNELIQRVDIYLKHEVLQTIPSPNFPQVKLDTHHPQVIDLNISDEELVKLSEKNLWALTLDEMKFIQNYYKREDIQLSRTNQNLPKWPVDIEMEILAQTWSEHCKHKIFSANIKYSEDAHAFAEVEDKKINGIFKTYIKDATSYISNELKKDWLISVFTDNAGIVRFDDHIDYCLKVETHNSPSALDPYGGALTGILGVNRDILGCGIGAKPIANTDVLCFAPSDYSQEILAKMPKKLRHPKSILKGVHRGIEDGGNKSGIPTVNGAIMFNDNYAGKPLVYCGTVGVLPQKLNSKPTYLKNQKPGDYIVICGGSVGADGIHGATFSSMELKDDAPSTAVQIGDPFTQKKLTDFLLMARDKDLYNSVTDNGAGGLSSSVGEMAEVTNGASININKVPLKYQGLSPYEIVISESQERMTFSVPVETLDQFTKLAEEMECNPAIIGSFHDQGSFDIYADTKLLASLDLGLMHDDLPPMELEAHFDGPKSFTPWHEEATTYHFDNLEEKITKLMGLPNIKSKHHLVKQFDSEVKAATITKPFIQKKNFGPSDAAVIWGGAHEGSEDKAICISSGLIPQISHIDTYKMTEFAIDEAFRNAVASGANPNYIAFCDNYCWPDPIPSEKNPDAKHKLAQLVRSGEALYRTALAYEAPFISGKDSMKNDFIGATPDGNEIKISVPPTLLVTSIAKVDHIEHVRTTDFKMENHIVYYVGPSDFEKEYYHSLNTQSLELPSFNAKDNFQRYNNIHKLIQDGICESIHDISDGGIIGAIIESCFPSQLGFKFKESSLLPQENLDYFLFNELPGGFIISIKPEDKNTFESIISGAREIGLTTKDSTINIIDTTMNVNELYKVWSDYES